MRGSKWDIQAADSVFFLFVCFFLFPPWLSLSGLCGEPRSDWLREAHQAPSEARRMPECSAQAVRVDGCEQGGTDGSRARTRVVVVMMMMKMKMMLCWNFFFFKTLFWTEGAGVSRLIWLQVKCDVLAACCEISLTTTTSSTTTITTITDAPSQEWWALSWPDRGVSISTASCPRGDARGMTARGRAREVAAETSCLPPWCSSPTSCQGCCGKPTTAHMWGGWRGSGRSRGFSGSRRRSRRLKCSNCWGRWGGGDWWDPWKELLFWNAVIKKGFN